MPDAVTVLRDDHRRVEKLFKEFEKLHKKDGSAAEKRRVVEEVIRELSVHAVVEEQVFYPAVREQVEDAEDTVLEGLEEHHIVKWTLSELAGMTGEEERHDAKVTVLIESVRHHVEEEEQEMFPKVREAIPRKALTELAERMEQARQSAPTEPRPKAEATSAGGGAGGSSAGAAKSRGGSASATSGSGSGTAGGSATGGSGSSGGSGSGSGGGSGSSGPGSDSGTKPRKAGLLGRRRTKAGSSS